MSQKGDRSNKLINNNSSGIVIGGGISGLIAATLLQRKGIKVTVIDKGRGIGGRLATRRIKYSETIEGICDYGTQYFSVKQPGFQVWVDDWLEQGVIKEWCQGFNEVDGKPRYCGINGTRGIAKYLAQDLDVCTSTRVFKINYDRLWLVETNSGKKFQGDFLVMTPPVPQSLKLLDDSNIALPPDIRQSLEQVDYHSCIAVLALLDRPSSIPQPGGIGIADENLVWLADNYQKGISPNGHAITLHATPSFSEKNWDNTDADIAQKLFAAASTWLDSSIIEYQVHRWRYSLPKTLYGQSCLTLPELSLTFGGDAFVAPKIEGAVLSGIAIAKSINH
ncbi:MAG: NAD(P)/FAD-dependent oxidoreductase [Pleurocapsa sp.]